MRGQGLSLNVIVIAALALIVLIVLVVIFSGRINIFTKGTGTCSGDCVDAREKCGTDAAVPTSNCDDGKNPVVKNGWCCIKT